MTPSEYKKYIKKQTKIVKKTNKAGVEVKLKRLLKLFFYYENYLALSHTETLAFMLFQCLPQD